METGYFTAVAGGAAASIVEKTFVGILWALLFANISRQSGLLVLYGIGAGEAGIFMGGVVAAWKGKINWRWWAVFLLTWCLGNLAFNLVSNALA